MRGARLNNKMITADIIKNYKTCYLDPIIKASRNMHPVSSPKSDNKFMEISLCGIYTWNYLGIKMDVRDLGV